MTGFQSAGLKILRSGQLLPALWKQLFFSFLNLDHFGAYMFRHEQA